MEIKLNAESNDHSMGFLQGMINRMDMSYLKYGRSKVNYKGNYSKEFVDDLKYTLLQFLDRWDNNKSNSTSANGNAIIFMFRRIYAYFNGKGGDVAGNTEYLIDSANALMIEFESPQVQGAYFKPTDNRGSTGFAGLSEREAEEIHKSN